MRTRARPRGLGSTYRRGQVWWVSYQHRGERIREPGGLDGRGAATKEEAEAKLKQRLGEIAAQRFAGPEADRLTVAKMLDDYLDHLELRGAKSVKQARSHLAPVRGVFASDRAMEITTTRLRDYTAARLAAADSEMESSQRWTFRSSVTASRCSTRFQAAWRRRRASECRLAGR